ncbi:MAG: hypothetical protein K0Q49_113 [Haloplasmataceae bacterium]|jgi:hypothetical protein|nr:hypothetical protein [Haloplasmataceae bacterium]
MQQLYVILLLIGLFAFLAIGMYLNKKTPIPAGCELPSMKCEHCVSVSCGYSESNRVQEIKDEIKQSIKTNSGEGENNGNIK